MQTAVSPDEKYCSFVYRAPGSSDATGTTCKLCMSISMLLLQLFGHIYNGTFKKIIMQEGGVIDTKTKNTTCGYISWSLYYDYKCSVFTLVNKREHIAMTDEAS